MGSNAHKTDDAQKIKELTVDSRDQNSVFTDNKLSWQNIILTQEKWANTDDSWRSVIALILTGLGIIFTISLVLNSLFG
jgi:hypothetical protein